MQFLLSRYLSTDGRVIFPFKDFLEISLSFSECTTFVSRSFFPSDCELTIVDALDSLSQTAPVSWRPRRGTGNCGGCQEG